MKMSPKHDKLVAIIMAGGSGTRFWPLSTAQKPKQFLQLFTERSLIQKCFDRLEGIISPDRMFVITNQIYEDMVAEHLPEIPRENIIGEPEPRDTAPAVCLGNLLVRKKYGNATTICLPADHLINPVSLFHKHVMSATKRVRKTGLLYTLGIEPGYPAVEYGYLETSGKTETHKGFTHAPVLRFVEKPDLATASKYLESGRYLWNSAIYLWKADAILQEFERYTSSLYKTLSRVVEFYGTHRWEECLAMAYEELPRDSLEYSVMEHLKNIVCIRSRFAWNDVGNWPSLKQYLQKDKNNNATRGIFYSINSEDNLVYCEDEEETVVLIGVKNLVVVRSGDKTLVVHKNRTQEIKTFVNSLHEPRAPLVEH